MSDDLKWWDIERAVWERGPREKAQRAVLAQLARHSDHAGVTFVGQPKMAVLTGFSETTVKRAIAALEFAGWIRIEERAVLVETRRGFEKKGNLYRLDLVKLGLALPKSSKPSARPGKSGGEGRSDEGSGPAAATSDVEGGCPVANTSVEGKSPARAGRLGWSREAEETSSARSHLRGGEVSLEARRGVIRGAPLINVFEPEERTERQNPIGSPSHCADVETCERQPQRQKLPDQEHCMQRAAFGEEQKQKLPDRDGGSAKVVVFPQRQRATRELRAALYGSIRSTLDGEDAALWDEATRVMRACGVSPESSGRKVRRAVLEALSLECDRSGRAIADVGLLMERRWHEYEALGSLRYAPMGFRKFIAEGDWLRQNWGLDRARLREMRRGGL